MQNRHERFTRRWRHRRPPPWWAEGAPWPPPRWQRRHFFPRALARLGCGLFFGLLVCGSSIWLIQYLSGNPQSASQLLTAAVIGLLILGAFAVVQSGIWLRRLTLPLDDVLTAANRLAAGETSVRVRERGLPEMRGLARAFNNMADQLEHTQALRRDLFADVSHELQTPLTIIQGELEGMLDGLYGREDSRLQSLLDETKHVSTLVDDLRTLSLAEANALQLRREPTELGDLVLDVAASFKAQADRAEVQLIPDVNAGGFPVEVDPVRMREVMANLVANALDACQAGDTVNLTYHQEADTHLLEIRDSGRGIDHDRIPQLFTRFGGAADSSGSGLGLPIVKRLVEAHGGEITVESELGEGTTVQIRLPALNREG